MAGDYPNSEAASGQKSSARGFWANVARGLTAGGLVIAGAMPGPRVPETDMGSDWNAIGGDVRAALRKYAARSG
jgi:hypothetical protein